MKLTKPKKLHGMSSQNTVQLHQPLIISQ